MAEDGGTIDCLINQQKLSRLFVYLYIYMGIFVIPININYRLPQKMRVKV